MGSSHLRRDVPGSTAPRTMGTNQGHMDPSWNQETGVVTAPRTEILSRSADELLERRILPRYEPTEAWLAYIAHHVASKKVPIWVHGLETERVLDHYEWHEVGPDHLFHAATYEMIARQAPHAMIAPPIGLITTRRGKALEEGAGVEPRAWLTRRRG